MSFRVAGRVLVGKRCRSLRSPDLMETMMKRNALFACAFAAATILSGGQASAQEMSLNYSKISYDYSPGPAGGLPFELDLTIGTESTAVLRPVGSHHLTLKRGVFHPADPLSHSTLEFSLGREGAEAQAGTMVIDVIPDAGSGGESQVRMFTAADGRELGFALGRSDLGDAIELRFEPIGNGRLSGHPAPLFNQPAAGETLIARLPVPAVGQSQLLTLKISDRLGATSVLPVRLRTER